MVANYMRGGITVQEFAEDCMTVCALLAVFAQPGERIVGGEEED